MPGLDLSPSQVGLAVLFSTITFILVLGRLQHNNTAFSLATGSLSQKIAPSLYPPTKQSFYLLFLLLSQFGLLLLYVYICENAPPHHHGEKSYDRDVFFLLTGMLFVSAATTSKANGGLVPCPASSSSTSSSSPNDDDTVKTTKPADNTILNRYQTEEWKGWMQFMFLYYHYYHAEETYNSIRIMITCYVWMTGFGNFSFFYMKNDYSVVRVIQMLWRLNFLVLFLMLTMNNTYILYYICPLHTFFFLMVYCVMRIGRSINYTKYKLRVKLFVLAFLIFLVWDCDTPLFKSFHFFLGETPTVGATGGQLWEWYFRTTLDHWSTFLGMIFAANYPVTALYVKKVEKLPAKQQWMFKGCSGALVACVFIWWVINLFLKPKLEYNLTNAYFGFIPLLTYIFFRNIHPTLRGYSLDMLHQIGKTTLETYLLQHHIWLTSNAKSLLIVFPGWPKCNMLFVTVIYFLVSRKAYALTMSLRGMLLPNDLSACIQSLGFVFLTLIVCALFGLALSFLGFDNVFGISVVSLCIAFVVDHKLFSPPAQVATATPTASSKYKVAAVVALAASVLFHAYTRVAATSISPLPPYCQSWVAKGEWFSVDNCAESIRADAHYSSNIGSFAVCGGASSWGWEEQPARTHCRFARRTKKELSRQLNNHNIMFVGDSVVRNVFYSLSRMLGDASVEDVKHGDIDRKFGTTNISFRWAPLAVDQIEILEKIRGWPISMVVAGNGLWDALEYKNEEDIEEGIKEYKSSMKSLGERLHTIFPGAKKVWLSPTTINDSRLQTEDKKKFMQEAKVLRYREAGYLTVGAIADFNLDLSSITRERVNDSIDGVHYPDGVYDVIGQILGNAFDWLLEKNEMVYTNDYHAANQPGKMSNAGLGVMMLVLCFIGLFSFDSFFGLVLGPALFCGGVDCTGIWEEAFSALHKKIGVGSNREGEVRGNSGSGQSDEAGTKGVGGQNETKSGIDIESLLVSNVSSNINKNGDDDKNDDDEGIRSDLELEMEPLTKR